MQTKMSIDDLHRFLDEDFTQVKGRFEVIENLPMQLSVRMKAGEGDLRPGGTVSGPAMFMLADCAFYLATLAMIGPKALAVTTNATINFLRKPPPGDLWAEARVRKLGRRLSVGDVLIYGDGQSDPVAMASMTYSIPPSSNDGV